MGKEAKQKSNDLIFRNSIFIRIALATVAILLIPFVAMQYTTEVRWDETDFIVMGSLLFGIASLFVLAARRAARKHRMFIGMMFLATFVGIWAAFAVGDVTSIGN